MGRQSIFESVSQFKNPKKYSEFLFRSVATSTAIEIGTLPDDIIKLLRSYKPGSVNQAGGITLENFRLPK